MFVEDSVGSQVTSQLRVRPRGSFYVNIERVLRRKYLKEGYEDEGGAKLPGNSCYMYASPP